MQTEHNQNNGTAQAQAWVPEGKKRADARGLLLA